MNSFSAVLSKLDALPLNVSWQLESIAEKRGHQELYTRQSPEQLARLREYAMVESAVSSNRIEGVEVDGDRVGTIVFGNGIMKDRDEEEVRGYRKALDLIHTASETLPLSLETICRFHALSRPSIWDSGKFRTKDCEIIQTYPDGTSRVRYKAVEHKSVVPELEAAIEAYENTVMSGRISPLVALAAFNLDFLCIHPFRDGNGRVSRLLLLYMLYRLGYEAGRYVSVERMIELSKDRYYETLEKSSVGWHEGRQDIWPYVNYVLYTVDEVYEEFESRFAKSGQKRGEKTRSVEAVLNDTEGKFTLRDIEWKCPGVSKETIRSVLKAHPDCFVCEGRGVSARWLKVKNLSEEER